jgi:hypothetical protein
VVVSNIATSAAAALGVWAGLVGAGLTPAGSDSSSVVPAPAIAPLASLTCHDTERNGSRLPPVGSAALDWNATLSSTC